MAARFWRGTTDVNWSNTNNWSATSGGATGVAIPTAADDVTFDANGNNNCTLNTAVAKVCKTLTVTAGYTQTMTFDVNLTVSGSVTLQNTFTFAGTGTLAVNSTSTLTSNGKTVNIPFQLQGSAMTHTLADNWTVSGLLTLAAPTTGMTVNGNNFYITGSFLNGTATTGITAGTTTLNFTGTGSWSSTSTTSQLRLNMVINTAGTFTLSGFNRYNTGTITYTAGTVVTTGSTLDITAATTLNVNGITWETLGLNGGGGTITLSSNIQTINLITLIGTTGTTLTGNTVSVSGDWTHTTTSGLCSGTTTIELTGTGNWTGSTTTGVLRNNVTVNTAGTITMIGDFRYNTGTLTHTAGTVVGGTSNFIIGTAAPTIAINATGFSFGDIQPSVSTSFGGTEGFTMYGFSCSTVGLTFTWKSGETYTVTNHVSMIATAASHTSFVASTGGVQAIWTLQAGATRDVDYYNATDIDSSLGQTVYSYKGGSPVGTFSNTLNWSLLSPSNLIRGYGWVV